MWFQVYFETRETQPQPFPIASQLLWPKDGLVSSDFSLENKQTRKKKDT